MNDRLGKQLRSQILLMILVGALTGCLAMDPGSADRSLVTGLPCAPPCWQGLVPCITTEEEAKAELGNSPYVRDLGWSRYTEEATWSSPHSRFGKTDMFELANRNGLTLKDGVAQWISVNLDYSLTLGESIAIYGPPEVIVTYLNPLHVVYFGADLLYPEIGLALVAATLDLPADRDARATYVAENMWIVRARFFCPTSVEDMLKWGLPFLDARTIRDQGREWPGFSK